MGTISAIAFEIFLLFCTYFSLSGQEQHYLLDFYYLQSPLIPQAYLQQNSVSKE